MKRQEAFELCKSGFKITHVDFLDHEYLQYVDNEIQTEDGFYFEDVFWNLERFQDGWSLYKN